MEDTRNTKWANDQSSFGFKMLSKMGWSKGKGLGRKEQGDQKHVAVSRRADKVGIGAKNDVTGNSSFTSGIMNFQSVLQNLAKVHGPVTVEETIEESSSSDSDSDASDEESKKEKSSKKAGKDDKGHKKHHHHHHRRRVTHKVTKYVDAKDVASYKADDLAAIFGRTAAFPVIAAVNSGSKDSSSSSAAVGGAPVAGRAFGRASAESSGEASEAGGAEARRAGDATAALGSKRGRDPSDEGSHPGLGLDSGGDGGDRPQKRSKKEKKSGKKARKAKKSKSAKELKREK